MLVGPPASGKSTWAAQHFPPDQVVSSDGLRAVVGTGEHDQRASKDAFDLLDLVVERRLRRRLTTVVDTLGTDTKRRRRWLAAAAKAGVPCVAVVFDADPAVCRARNRARERPIPSKVLSSMLAGWPAVRDGLHDDGFVAVHPPDGPVVVAPDLVAAPAAAARQKESPMPLDFGLQIPRFTWPGGPAETRARLTEVATAAEGAGFSSIWVMDHFLQIPPVGPHWEDMLDSYSTLAFLAGRTETARLGTLVTGVTYRNIAHLAKIVATLDVLSGGRAMCGIGAAWFEREHRAYGWTFPPLAERYAMLEDALELLPLMWGKGAPAYSGRTIEVAEAVCYPRPLQDRVPSWWAGRASGRRCGWSPATPTPATCSAIRTPCATRSRCSTATAPPRAATRPTSPCRSCRPPTRPTVDDHIGRYRRFAEAGVQTVIVNFPDLTSSEPLTRFADVIATFRA